MVRRLYWVQMDDWAGRSISTLSLFLFFLFFVFFFSLLFRLSAVVARAKILRSVYISRPPSKTFVNLYLLVVGGGRFDGSMGG